MNFCDPCRKVRIGERNTGDTLPQAMEGIIMTASVMPDMARMMLAHMIRQAENGGACRTCLAGLQSLQRAPNLQEALRRAVTAVIQQPDVQQQIRDANEYNDKKEKKRMRREERKSRASQMAVFDAEELERVRDSLVKYRVCISGKHNEMIGLRADGRVVVTSGEATGEARWASAWRKIVEVSASYGGGLYVGRRIDGIVEVCVAGLKSDKTVIHATGDGEHTVFQDIEPASAERIKELAYQEWVIERTLFAKAVVGCFMLAGVFITLAVLYFNNFHMFLSNMELMWVVDHGARQSFPMPLYAASALWGVGELDFAGIFLGYLVETSVPFIPLAVAAALSLVICSLFELDYREKVSGFYGICILVMMGYMFFNPRNFSGTNFAFWDVGFFAHTFAIMTPLMIGALLFSFVLAMGEHEEGSIIAYLVGMGIFYILAVLIASGVKNNIIGYHGIWGDPHIRFGYHLPWLGFIIAGAITAFVSLIPSAVIVSFKAKPRIFAFIVIVGALSFYGFGDAILGWIDSL